ncbi:MAG TPA: hypothetical protein VGG28_11070 [Kofleriaceae bacterium]
MELIASALEIAMQRWDQDVETQDEDHLIGTFADLAVRVAAFEMLFGLLGSRGGRRPRVLDALVLHVGAASSRYCQAFLDTRHHAGRRLAARPLDHRHAILAELVVLGCASRAYAQDASCSSAHLGAIDTTTVAVSYAKGVVLIGQDSIESALEVFTSMLARAPGSLLALEQAARCSDALGDHATAASYSRRASRDRRRGSSTQSGGRQMRRFAAPGAAR